MSPQKLNDMIWLSGGTGGIALALGFYLSPGAALAAALGSILAWIALGLAVLDFE